MQNNVPRLRRLHHSLTVASIGGDLVQVLGGRGRRVSAENFFYRPPKCEIGGGDSLSLGTKCWLSIIM